MTVSKLEKYLNDNSDKNNVFQQEKIARYKNLRKLFNELDKSIKANGATITVINGAQKYTKVNPAIAEKEKLNSQLLTLEKEIQMSIRIYENGNRKDSLKTPPKEDKGGLV
ncbi:P27 family phage terminase small subunit [Pediococcus inopinatus]|mgnify:CR=1 FL=1|uniref:P27 family phage terminase small subunit n=1 Tax=Pediococcus inopinatus TaxID=114090 RepID=UPI0007C5B196|nr:P27 family phage terminase small subunit [Pediococcus inopinatus]